MRQVAAWLAIATLATPLPALEPVPQQQEAVKGQPSIRALDDKESAYLGAQAAYLRRIYAMAHKRADGPLTLEMLQDLYRGFAAEKVDDQEAVYALGLAFGEEIRRATGMEWVVSIDEHGASISLAVPGKVLLVHPVDMIQKRLEDGAAVDLRQLLEDTVRTIAAQQRASPLRDR